MSKKISPALLARRTMAMVTLRLLYLKGAAMMATT
jgi:hypothetical protein